MLNFHNHFSYSVKSSFKHKINKPVNVTVNFLQLSFIQSLIIEKKINKKNEINDKSIMELHNLWFLKGDF